MDKGIINDLLIRIKSLIDTNASSEYYMKISIEELICLKDFLEKAIDSMHNEEFNKQKRKEGIDRALKRGVHFGRYKLKSKGDIYNIALQFKNKQITMDQAVQMCGFSKSTFRRRLKEISINI